MSENVSQSHVLSTDVMSTNLQLEVVSGVHMGVSLSLEDGDYSIGSKADSDIVLRDDGVAAQHVVICIDGKDVRAEAIGGDLRIGNEEIEAGHGYRLRLPAELIIGGASIKLSRNGKHTGFFERIALVEKIAARPTAAALSALGCVLAIIAVLYSIQSSARDDTSSEFAMTNNSTNARIHLPNNPTDIDVASATQALEAKLRTAGLVGIKIQADGTHIKATGRIPENRSPDWGSIQRWFDKTYAPGLLLTASVEPSKASAEQTLHLQAIWYGDRPYIIADNGTRYYEGAVLDNGWLLQSIDNERIMLKKDEEVLTLSYK